MRWSQRAYEGTGLVGPSLAVCMTLNSSMGIQILTKMRILDLEAKGLTRENYKLFHLILVSSISYDNY